MTKTTLTIDEQNNAVSISRGDMQINAALGRIEVTWKKPTEPGPPDPTKIPKASKATTYSGLRKEHLADWERMAILPAHLSTVDWFVNQILEGKESYDKVASETGVPAFLIGAIHGRESTFNFARTIRDGKNAVLPEAWIDDAITVVREELASIYPNKISSWGPAECLYFLLRYNGVGYRLNGPPRPMRSPYVFSMSDHYKVGKYTSDGNFDPDHVDVQVGCGTALRRAVNQGLASMPLDLTL